MGFAPCVFPGVSIMSQLNVNGRVHDVGGEPEMPPLWVLRDELKLADTRYGCGIAQCGASATGKRIRSLRLKDGKLA